MTLMTGMSMSGKMSFGVRTMERMPEDDDEHRHHHEGVRAAQGETDDPHKWKPALGCGGGKGVPLADASRKRPFCLLLLLPVQSALQRRLVATHKPRGCPLPRRLSKQRALT